MTPEAHAHLSRRCKVMSRLIRAHGPCTIIPEAARSPFQSLVMAVAHQQLNGTAANTILRRFVALFPGKRFPTAARLVSVTDEALRACGFSWAKIASIRDIAAKTLDGTVPSSRAIVRMPDEEIIERLVQVRGVGRWTVEMLLIFKLGRPDVLPIDDFGVRNGFPNRLQASRKCPSRRNFSPSGSGGDRMPPQPHGISGAPPISRKVRRQ